MQTELDHLAATSTFHYQRKLMAGGTCEATPFVWKGLASGALCLPLENYHNMSPDGQIVPESVRRSDWNHLVTALVHLLAHPPGRKPAFTPLDQRLKANTQKARRLLRRSALT
jgi:endoglucanase